MQCPLAAVLRAVCERRYYLTVSVAVVPHCWFWILWHPLIPAWLGESCVSFLVFGFLICMYNGCVCVIQSGCSNKIPWVEWLVNSRRNLLLVVLEVEVQVLGASMIKFWCRPKSGCRQLTSPSFFMWMNGTLWSLFYKDTHPSCENSACMN